MDGESARIAVITSTVGRAEGIERLLKSLADQSLRPAQVIVVDQSSTGVVRQICERATDLPGVSWHSSPIGLSKGRNTGLANVARDIDIVAFTDDDCRYHPDALQQACAILQNPRYDGLTGLLESSQGARLSFGAVPARLNSRNVWTHAIEATIFLKADLVRQLGGFDECLGLGASTPWQSGEGTDFLLRAIQQHDAVIEYRPEILVYEDALPAGVSGSLHKARKYARGTGRVYRTHYGPTQWAKILLRPIMLMVARMTQGQRQQARRSALVALGRLEGLLGRTIGNRLP